MQAMGSVAGIGEDRTRLPTLDSAFTYAIAGSLHSCRISAGSDPDADDMGMARAFLCRAMIMMQMQTLIRLSKMP